MKKEEVLSKWDLNKLKNKKITILLGGRVRRKHYAVYYKGQYDAEKSELLEYILYHQGFITEKQKEEILGVKNVKNKRQCGFKRRGNMDDLR